MLNADTTVIELAEKSGLSLATFQETRGHTIRGVRAGSQQDHVPGDTRTPPAPNALWIGSGDA